VITRGVNLNELIGQEFETQGIRFFGFQECRPCYWMNRAIAPGAEDFLKGNGGLRAKILTNGEVRSTAGIALGLARRVEPQKPSEQRGIPTVSA
jgi:MOSC domain-containing protein YiiM